MKFDKLLDPTVIDNIPKKYLKKRKKYKKDQPYFFSA